MPTKMLIDAAHPEETRVVVQRDGKVEEFDFEAANRRQLRGNIYLAKVTRVEPSLQAAFVDYGGNRHGFLAFSEIHPDYYQIPYADRQALLEEEVETDDDDDDSPEDGKAPDTADAKATDSADDETPAESGSGDDEAETTGSAARAVKTDEVSVDEADDGDESEDNEPGDARGEQIEDVASSDDNGDGDGESVESVGGDDALEEVPVRKSRPRKSYKIQEVIKKRQILLVQVVKEERGNKGAALTTYLSLAGRYSVLMPNTARGGGISRKIVNASDRKRLKGIVSELDVPEGMGVILRTAGASRTKSEIKRDFEYLLRLWENVRELTLESVAPTLVYEEGSLVKRAIRDLYTKDIDQVQVAGDEAYREAKDFMRMLMPSHAKNIQPYRDPEPIFNKNKVEAQLDAMFSPRVTLKSGGYIILNQTEALVSIDVNSGRSTREHNIEDTALKTNLEAADEVARQLRLRDLAGLIVIDFIDMEEKRNNRAVERRMKDALRHDRARIQVGRISHFGLLEMSRQRIRAGVLESTTQICPHCEGTGHVRSVESVALHLLRSIEAELLKGKPTDLTLRTRTEVALYVLNHKRPHLRELEDRFGVLIVIEADDSVSASSFELERGEPARAPRGDAVVRPVSVDPSDEALDDQAQDDEDDTEERQSRGEDDNGGRRRRRRRRRKPSGGDGDSQRNEARDSDRDEALPGTGDQPDIVATDNDGDESGNAGDEQASSGGRRRRRGRRGGRRHRGAEANAPSEDATSEDATSEGAPSEGATSVGEGSDDAESNQDAGETETVTAEAAVATDTPAAETAAETAPDAASGEAAADDAATDKADEKPKRRPRRSRRKTADAEAGETADAKTAKADDDAVSEPVDAPVEGAEAVSADEALAVAEETPVPAADEAPAPVAADAPAAAALSEEPLGEPVAETPAEPEPPREPVSEGAVPEQPKKGWWQRRSLFGN